MDITRIPGVLIGRIVEAVCKVGREGGSGSTCVGMERDMRRSSACGRGRLQHAVVRLAGTGGCLCLANAGTKLQLPRVVGRFVTVYHLSLLATHCQQHRNSTDHSYILFTPFHVSCSYYYSCPRSTPLVASKTICSPAQGQPCRGYS